MNHWDLTENQKEHLKLDYKSRIVKMKIIPAFKNAMDYIVQVEQINSDISDLWYKVMVDPFWNDLAKWAPFDHLI